MNEGHSGSRAGRGWWRYALVLVALSAAGWAAPPRLVPLAAPSYTQVSPQGRVVVHPAQAVADRLLLIMEPVAASLATPQAVATAAVAGARVQAVLPRSRVLVVDLPAGSDLAEAAARFQARPEVQLAVPDTLVYPQLIPNDPKYPQQYHLPLVRAPEAWEVTTGSAAVVIAIVDSGVDLNHPDVAGKLWTNPGEIPGNGRDDDGNGYVDDVQGWNFVENNNNVSPVPKTGQDNSVVSHGTLAAGLAAAVSNEGYGAAGVDWRARIMPVKIFANDGMGTVSGVLQGIEYATANGAKVINLSLGGGWNAAYTPVIQAAYNAGIVVVCAAGNQSQGLGNAQSTWQSPVCNNGPNPLTDNMIVGVGATDRSDRKSYYSNWDNSTNKNFVDLCAPGDELYGPVYQDAGVPGVGPFWGTNSGTSFSSPLVAGAAALILAREPGLTPAQVIARLKSTTDNIDALNPGYAGKLGGRLNLARALGQISPPQMVQNLAAADTPGDEGGSITLTWLKSGDDGGGANNVTKYVVRRRQGTTGTYAAIQELPPGTVEYVDGKTTDGVDYYYVVRTFAGTLFSDSVPVGPVQSRNDAPPPAVTTLKVADRPNDSGGAIVLAWTYTPPADFQEYRVYREPYAFTNVTGRTPVAVLSGRTTKAWVDTGVTDGSDYYYAVTAVDTFGNELKFVTAVGPVQSFPNQDLTFGAGVRLMATPVLPADRHPATLLGLTPGELVYAWYNPATARYVTYTGEPLPVALRLTLGQGFWVKLPRTVTVSPEGQSAPAGDMAMALRAGWHTLGNPFFAAVDFGSCTVSSGGVTMDLAAAQAAGLLLSTAWVWDPEVNGYRMINGDMAGSRLIAPWQGFWVQALKACTLNLVRPLGPAATGAAAPRAAAAAPAGDWRLRLTAQAGGYQDLDNYLGTGPQAAQVESPPLPGEGVDLALGQGRGGAPVALRMVTEGGSLTQPLTVSWAGVTGPVRLAWPEVNTLASDKTFLLTDLATGTVTNLRNSPAYVFQAQAPSGQREFTLTVAERAPGALQVTAMVAQATAAGAEIAFALSGPATCDLQVLNLAGRTVRQVLTGAPRAAGQNVVRWDGRNQGGAPVPAGRYLVSLQARDEHGGVVRMVRDLTIVK